MGNPESAGSKSARVDEELEYADQKGGKTERHYWKRKAKYRPKDVQEDVWTEIYAEPLIDIETFVASPEYLNADPLFPRQAGVLTEFFNPLKSYSV